MYAYRYFAIIVVIDGDNSTGIISGTGIGPYDEAAASKARSDDQPYAYVAGIVNTSIDIDNYPHSYTLGDGGVSHNGEMNYVNVRLQPDTQYVVVVRAYTADDLVLNCILGYCMTFFEQLFVLFS